MGYNMKYTEPPIKFLQKKKDLNSIKTVALTTSLQFTGDRGT